MSVDDRKLKKAIRLVFTMGSDQKILTNDANEACKKLGIRPDDLFPKQLEDFIDKNG